MSDDSITLTVNGDRLEVPRDLTLTALLARLKLRPELVAVELNGEVVPRTEFATRRIPTAARLEIVQFVGGG